jgi:hypothetical protein
MSNAPGTPLAGNGGWWVKEMQEACREQAPAFAEA